MSKCYGCRNYEEQLEDDVCKVGHVNLNTVEDCSQFSPATCTNCSHLEEKLLATDDNGWESWKIYTCHCIKYNYTRCRYENEDLEKLCICEL